MKLNNFVKENFNRHLPYLYLLVMEDENINIYDKPYEGLIISHSQDVKFQLIKILEITNHTTEVKLKVRLPNNKKGFITPQQSILIIPKEKMQVKISENALLDNELNSHMNINIDFLQDNKHKIVSSKYYAIFNDEIYETLVLVDEIIGFIKQNEINTLYRYIKEFKIINTTKIYSDNMLTKPVSEAKENQNTFKSQYVISSENKIRIKYQGKNLWINGNDTDLEIDKKDRIYSDINELIIDSMLTQYEEKINNYHKYYSKVLTQLK